MTTKTTTRKKRTTATGRKVTFAKPAARRKPAAKAPAKRKTVARKKPVARARPATKTVVKTVVKRVAKKEYAHALYIYDKDTKAWKKVLGSDSLATLNDLKKIYAENYKTARFKVV